MVRHSTFWFLALLLVMSAGWILPACGGSKRCRPEDTSRCADGKMVWVDSCGEIGETIETCGCGCNADDSACREPDCVGKHCGDDGCGGNCGDCIGCEGVHDPDLCTDGTCAQVCCPDCTDRQCGDDGCGGICGTCDALETCGASGQCECAFSACGDACCGENEVCHQDACCAPGCTDRECGDDGCGGTCGSCPDGEACNAQGLCEVVCTPDCTDLECGDDGCGGSCGNCSAGESCNAQGLCEAVCKPECTNLQCGDDGCGGSCGKCQSGEICNAGGQCACVPECNSRECGDDGCGGTCGTCQPGETCDGNGLCQACREDAFEDNDDAGSASPVTAGAYASLRACMGDDDFYSIDLSTGDEITVDQLFLNAEGDMDLGLLDPDGVLVATSLTGTDNEQVSHTAQQDGIYVIWVRLFQDAGVTLGNDYDLVVWVNSICPDDEFEDNDDAGTATPVTADTYPGLRLCLGDDDFYSIDLSAGDEITVNQLFLNAEGDMDLGLLDPDGVLVATSQTGTDNEQVSHTAQQDGTFVIWTSMYADLGVSNGNDYDLNIGVAWSNPTCPDDGFEDNDDIGSAVVVTEGTYEPLRICPGDDDFFSINLLVGDEITLDATFLQAEGDIDIGIVDPNANIVAASMTGTDNERIVYTAAEDGLHVIWVNFYEDLGASEGNDYAMAIDVVESSPACLDDAFEDNDDADNATPASDGFDEALHICPADDDFFSIYLDAGAEISVDIHFLHAGGDLDLVLINPEGLSVAMSLSVTDDEQIIYTATQSGTFVIQVLLFEDLGYDANDGNDYDMEVTVSQASPCPDDYLEENDSVDSPTPVTEGLYSALRACPDDFDYLSIDLAAGDEITANLVFSDEEGDLDLFLINRYDQVVAYSDSITDGEQIIYTADDNATYVILVGMYQDAGIALGNDYDLEIGIVPRSDCIDDYAEDNDDIETATPIFADQFGGLRMCPNDDDFFSIPLLIGDAITVDIFFLQAEGNIDLALLDPDGYLVDNSISDSDNEQVSFTSDQDGDWYIWVTLYDPDGVAAGSFYDMLIQVE